MKEQKKAAAPPPVFVVNAVQSVQSGFLNFANQLSPPFVQVLALATGVMSSQVIYAAAKLGIADLLKNGPKSSEYLAKETDCNSDAIYRLLRCLSSVGVFKETTDRTFALTQSAETLQKDHPMSVYPLALLIGDPIWTEPWKNILHSLKTGEDAFTYVFGKSYFDYLNENKEKSELFNNWMTRVSNMSCPVIASSYPFSKYNKVIDIGGGQGSQIAHILRKHPTVKGVLFDLPIVIDGPDEIDDDIAGRCEKVAGDFFESVPKGGDIYIMQQIIHDWSDELAIKILSNCREAMAVKGRILVVDAVIKSGNNRDMNKFIDMQMLMINKGGRERTKKEFTMLFQKAGLSLIKIIPTVSMFSIVEGQKA